MVKHDFATNYEVVIHCKGMDICELLDEHELSSEGLFTSTNSDASTSTKVDRS